MTFNLQVSGDGLDGGAAAQLALNNAEDAALLGMKTRRGFCVSRPRYPLSI